MTDVVRSGLRMFYFPAPLPGEAASYDWSFLRPVRTAGLAGGGTAAPLPDDFAGLEGDVRLVGSGRRPCPVAQTNEQQLRQRFFEEPDRTGQPQWCAVRWSQAGTAARGPRAELAVFPAADQDYTLEFQFYYAPDALSVTFPYPHGGATHAETIKAAVRAAAERDKGDQPGPQAAYFADRLKASVSLDRRMKAQTAGYNGDPGYGRGIKIGWPDRHWADPAAITYGGASP